MTKRSSTLTTRDFELNVKRFRFVIAWFSFKSHYVLWLAENLAPNSQPIRGGCVRTCFPALSAGSVNFFCVFIAPFDFPSF